MSAVCVTCEFPVSRSMFARATWVACSTESRSAPLHRPRAPETPCDREPVHRGCRNKLRTVVGRCLTNNCADRAPHPDAASQHRRFAWRFVAVPTTNPGHRTVDTVGCRDYKHRRPKARVFSIGCHASGSLDARRSPPPDRHRSDGLRSVRAVPAPVRSWRTSCCSSRTCSCASAARPASKAPAPKPSG